MMIKSVLVLALVACVSAKTIKWVGTRQDLSGFRKGVPNAANAHSDGLRIAFDSGSPGLLRLDSSTQIASGMRMQLANLKLQFDTSNGAVKIAFGQADRAGEGMNEYDTTSAQDVGCARNYNLASQDDDSNMVAELRDVEGSTVNTILGNSLIEDSDDLDFGGKPVRVILGGIPKNTSSTDLYMNIRGIKNIAGLPAGVSIESCDEFEVYKDILSRQFLDLCNPNFADPIADPAVAGLDNVGPIWLGATSENCKARDKADDKDECLPSSTCLEPFQVDALAERQREINEVLDKREADQLAERVVWSVDGDLTASAEKLAIYQRDDCKMYVAKDLNMTYFEMTGDYGTYELTGATVAIEIRAAASKFFSTAADVNEDPQSFSVTDTMAAPIMGHVNSALAWCVQKAAEEAGEEASNNADNTKDDCGADCSGAEFDDAVDKIDGAVNGGNGDAIDDVLDAIVCFDNGTPPCNATQLQEIAEAINNACGGLTAETQACRDSLTDIADAAKKSPEAKDAIDAAKDKAEADKAVEDAKQNVPQPRPVTLRRFIAIASRVAPVEKLSLISFNRPNLVKALKKSFQSSSLASDVKINGFRLGSKVYRRSAGTDGTQPLEVNISVTVECLGADTDADCMSDSDMNNLEDAANQASNGADLDFPQCRDSFSDSFDFDKACVAKAFTDAGCTSVPSACSDNVIAKLSKCDGSGFSDEATLTCFNERNPTEEELSELQASGSAAVASANKSSSSGLPIIPIAAAAAGCVLLAVLVVVAVKKGWIGGNNSAKTKSTDRNVVAFENPMYDDPTTGGSQPTYDAATGGADDEGLYDEPAFNAQASKDNPLYQSTEDLTAADEEGGYLDTGMDGGGYLDTEAAAEEGGYLDVAPDE
eukprot:m.477331 g.477331  ORF g.477331 m.477331 type:complete len:881 (+) comp20809_c0_seq1:248-2890(+)